MSYSFADKAIFELEKQSTNIGVNTAAFKHAF